MDGEFEKFKNILPTVECNTTAAKGHVSKAERSIRTVKERNGGWLACFPLTITSHDGWKSSSCISSCWGSVAQGSRLQQWTSWRNYTWWTPARQSNRPSSCKRIKWRHCLHSCSWKKADRIIKGRACINEAPQQA